MQLIILDYAYRPSNDHKDSFWISFEASDLTQEIDIPAAELGNYIAATNDGLFDREKLIVTIPEQGGGYYCHARQEYIEIANAALSYTVKDWLDTHSDDEFLIAYLRTEDLQSAYLLAA